MKLVCIVRTLHVKTKEFARKFQIFRITHANVFFHSPEKVVKQRFSTHAKFTTRFLAKTTELVSSKPIILISLASVTFKTKWVYSSTPANHAKLFFFVLNFLVKTVETAQKQQIFWISLAIAV